MAHKPANETCSCCLWLWRDLQHPASGIRICYHNDSPRFHRVCNKSDSACRAFEYAVNTTGMVKGRER